MDEPCMMQPGIMTVTGSISGMVSGTNNYEPSKHMLTFFPDKSFVPSETVTASVAGEKARSLSGHAMPITYEWSFTIGAGTNYTQERYHQ